MSHLSYVRQKNRDHGVPLDELTLDVTDHDRERAEDIVVELERLGVYHESASAGEPEPTPPPPAKQRREPVTDIWGNPITPRKRRDRK